MMQEKYVDEKSKAVQEGRTGAEKTAVPIEQKDQMAQVEQKISPTWAEETIMDLDDFIESQGVYIRQ